MIEPQMAVIQALSWTPRGLGKKWGDRMGATWTLKLNTFSVSSKLVALDTYLRERKSCIHVSSHTQILIILLFIIVKKQ